MLNEQPTLLTGYISNTSDTDKLYDQEKLANLLAQKDAINERYMQQIKEAEDRYKLDTALNIGGGALMIGSSFIPLGGLGTVAGTKLLAPVVGRAIGGAIGRGIASGAIGGGLYGLGSGLQQAKPVNEIAMDTAIGTGAGALTGGLLGGGLAKGQQLLTRGNLQTANKLAKLGIETLDDSTKIADINKNYYNNYVDGVGSKALADFRKLNTPDLGLTPTLDDGLNIFNKKQGLYYDLDNPWHIAQSEIIQNINPMLDDYHTGIRSADDIANAKDVFNVNSFSGTPDFTFSDATKALRDGQIKVYSSKDIVDGTFVTPSRMEAQNYAGNNPVNEVIVPIRDIAWNKNSGGLEGQYAPLTHIEYNLSKEPLKYTGRSVTMGDGYRYNEIKLPKQQYRQVLDAFNNSTSKETLNQNKFIKPIADTNFYLINDGFNEPIVTWRELIDKI